MTRPIPSAFYTIATSVCNRLEVDYCDVMSGCRTYEMNTARQLVVYFVRTHSDMSLHELAAAMGYSSHSSAAGAIALLRKYVADGERKPTRMTMRELWWIGKPYRDIVETVDLAVRVALGKVPQEEAA
jgi:chromosomal replication initiation ATPase DnaA